MTSTENGATQCISYAFLILLFPALLVKFQMAAHQYNERIRDLVGYSRPSPIPSGGYRWKTRRFAAANSPSGLHVEDRAGTTTT